MKKLLKILAVTMAIAMFTSVSVAAGNISGTYYFTANGQKVDSSTGVKDNDNDYYAYVTTLATGYNGVKSTVFPNGGTVYARTRLSSNREGVYSPLFTFRSNYAASARYDTGMAYFGSNYILRAETDYANYGGRRLVQAIRWCP